MISTLPESTWADMSSLWLWTFIGVIMIGVVVGNIRMIALSTLVTILVDEGSRGKANGQVGMVNGLVFTVVSVFSGFVIGRLGMDWAVAIGIALTIIIILHLLTLTFPREEHLESDEPREKNLDLK